MSALPLSSQPLVAACVALRLLGGSEEQIASTIGVPTYSVNSTLKRHGVKNPLRFMIDANKKANLEIPEWVPLVSDPPSCFSKRLGDALLWAVGFYK